MSVVFEHQQTAHCESGAISALLRHNGLDVSEAMVFGLSSALLYAYIPLIKLGGLPLFAYRTPPGRIIRGVTKRLGIKMHYQRFSRHQQGMQVLNNCLDAGKPVGLQASVFWLPYFPEDMRFHFNAHNLIAYGREGNDYLISDPTFENVVRADAPSLERARFVKGVWAPKGLLYYPEQIPAQIDFKPAIRKAIKQNTRMMLATPLPIIGVRGMRYVSRKLRAMGHSSVNEAQSKLFIGHMVRMQEEIGTGGAGFRFIYASFLQEAAAMLDNPAFETASKQFTDVGDEWRRLALFAAKMCKGRMSLNYDQLADQLLKIADMEEAAHRYLRQWV